MSTIQEEPAKVEPRYAQAFGWRLRIALQSGAQKVFLLIPPDGTKPAKLTSKQISSRQATREAIVEQCSVYVEDEQLDQLFGYRRHAGVYEPAELPWLMGQAAKLLDEETTR